MPGPAKTPRSLKVIAGTDRPDRAPETPPVSLPTLSEVPEAPDWLPNAHAKKEWDKLAPMLVAAGLLTDGGVSALGMLCSLHGKIVQLYAAGESPTGHMIAQYRGLVNDFGLTPGAQGRVKASGNDGPPNRFARFGKRKA